MDLELYRTYLEGLDLTETEQNALIETMFSIVTNVVDELFAQGTQE